MAIVRTLKDIHTAQRKRLRTEHAHLTHFLQLFAALAAKRRELQRTLADGLAAVGSAAHAECSDAQAQLAKVEGELSRLRDVRAQLVAELQEQSQALAEVQVCSGSSSSLSETCSSQAWSVCFGCS